METVIVITQDLVKTLFDYKEGKLYRKIDGNGKPCEPKLVKDQFGSGTCGYKRICINGKSYLQHRIIFLWHFGNFPNKIDHKDNNPLNNKIENLRECTINQNNHNSKKRSNNTSGIKGISWNKKHKKWRVYTCFNRKQIHLGFFEDLELAELVAIMAREKYHGEFANHG